MSDSSCFPSPSLRRFRAAPPPSDVPFVQGLSGGSIGVLSVPVPVPVGHGASGACDTAPCLPASECSLSSLAASLGVSFDSFDPCLDDDGRWVPPGSNTGGKSDSKGEGINSGGCKIDTLTFSFSGELFENHYLRSFVVWFERISGGLLSVGAVLDRKMNGYQECYRLCLASGADSPNLGWLGISRGDDSMRGRWCLHLTGVGCGLLRSGNWADLATDLPAYNGRITRIDLAVDDLEGRHSVSEIRSLYDAGAFNMKGRPPSFSEVRSSNGATFYVGRRGSGKLLRVYEKGKQLGDSSSPWVRHEIELRGTGRVIPFDILVNPISYFKGCYTSVYGWVSEGAASLVRTLRRTVDIGVTQAVKWGRRAVGRLICYLREVGKKTDSDIVDTLLKDQAGRDVVGKYPVRLFYADPLEAAIEAAWWSRPKPALVDDCPF